MLKISKFTINFNISVIIHYKNKFPSNFLLKSLKNTFQNQFQPKNFFNFYLQEVTGDDDSDLYLEEREAELKRAQEEKSRIQMSVPGMLNPYEVHEEMQDE